MKNVLVFCLFLCFSCNQKNNLQGIQTTIRMCTVEPKQYRGGGGYYCPSGQIVYKLIPNGQLILEGVGNNVSEVGTWGLSNDGNTLYIRDVRGSGSYNYTTFRYEGRKYEYWGHTNGRNTLSVF